MQNQGTGGLVLAQIDAALNRMRGFSPLPYGAGSGLLTIPGLNARVDLGNLFLILDWTPPSGSPADLPLVLRYKSATLWTSEFGKGWSMPYHRSVEEYAADATVYTPERAYHYERVGTGPDFAPAAPGANTLSGTPATGWTETQKDGTSFHYDTTGILRTIRNKAGTRWTLTWEGGTRVRSIAGPFGRRTSFVFDGAGMIRRMQDPGGRICTFTVDGNRNLVKAVTPALCVTSFVYIAPQGSGGAKNRLVARVDPLGNRTSFTYTLPADLNEPAVFQSFRLPTGPITTLTSGFSPPRTTIIDPRGGRWTTTFDSRTRPVATVDPLGIRTSYQWDSFSSYGLTRVTDGRGLRTTFGYVETSTGTYEPSSIQTAAGTYQFAYGAGGRLRRAIDERGNVSTLVWDGQGNRTAVIDPYGVRTSYAYDTYGRSTAVIDGLGRRSTRIYDAQGRPATDVDPLGNRTSYAYDPNSQLKRTVDPMNKIWTTVNDEMNRLIASVDPLNNRTSYTYDVAGRLTAQINPLGKATTRIYDANNRLVAVIDPLANRTTVSYDVIGNLIRMIDPLGKIATTVYNATNRPITQINALGNRTSYAYDAAWNAIRTIDPLGKIATTVYNATNRPSAVVTPLGNRTTTAYDAANNPIRSVNPLGRVNTTIYDVLNRGIVSVGPLLNRTTKAYDKAGRPVRVQDALGRIGTTTYDAAGRRGATIDPLLNRTSYSYDKAGRLVRVQDALGRIGTTTYDAAGRRVASLDAIGGRITEVYDAAGQRVAIVDARGNRTTFSYDAAGRQTQTLNPTGGRTTYGWNGAGRQAWRVDGRGLRTTYGYNDAGDVIKLKYQDAAIQTMVYDKLRRRVLLNDWTGRTSSTYDASGRLTETCSPDGFRTTYIWNSSNARAGMIISGGGRFTYLYDAAGMLRRVINPEGGITSWSHDAVSQVSAVRHANGTRASYVYDAVGRVLRVSDINASGVTLSSFTYKYDKNGNRVRALDVSGGITTWGYDDVDRLTSERRSGVDSYAVTNTYDQSGNRVSVKDGGLLTTYTYDRSNRVVRQQSAAGTNTYVYDGSGNLATVRPAAGQRTTYGWNRMDRLERVILPSGVRNTFIYNGEGLRVRSEDSLGVSKHVWDGKNVLIETNGSNAIQVVYSLAPAEYGQLVSQRRNGVSSFFHFDGLGSVARLSNTAGVSTDSYLYDSWGSVRAKSGSTVNKFMYVGRSGYYADIDSGLYYLRARHYSPVMARFVSQDKLGVIFNEYNLYSYVSNRPMIFIDPSGYCTPGETGAACVTGGVTQGAITWWYTYWATDFTTACYAGGCDAFGGCIQGAAIGCFKSWQAGCLGGVLGSAAASLCKVRAGINPSLGPCDLLSLIMSGVSGCLGGAISEGAKEQAVWIVALLGPDAAAATGACEIFK